MKPTYVYSIFKRCVECGATSAKSNCWSQRTCVISGCRREVDENCALLGYSAASSGNFIPTFRDNLAVQFSVVKKVGFLTLEYGTNWFSRNVGIKYPLLAIQ